MVAYWTGPWTRAAVEAWAADMAARWTADGVGKWMARDRSDGSLVGRGGFTRFDLDGETVLLTLGWAVRDARRGRGYATELGRAALAWAWVPLGSRRVRTFPTSSSDSHPATMNIGIYGWSTRQGRKIGVDSADRRRVAVQKYPATDPGAATASLEASLGVLRLLALRLSPAARVLA